MADAKISALDTATALDGSELLLLSQGGADAKLAISALNNYVAGWVRPTDWPTMPATAANKIDILAAVTDDASNYVAVRATISAGTYDVNWGDGTSSTGVTSATNAEHLYDYADADLGAVTTRGYKTAIITITPNTGGANITAFDIGQKHSRASLNAYTNPWLDIQVNCPSATSMTYRGGVEARWVERINIAAIGAVTTLASAFQNCSSLQDIGFPAGSLGSVTTLASAFQTCVRLQSVSFPSGSLASVTTLQNAFNTCSSLRSVSFPAGSLATALTFTAVFQNCSSLQTISFPSGSLAGATSLASAFVGCTSLQSVSFPAGSLASVTTLASTFSACSSLQSVSFPSGALGSVTDTTSTFATCTNLARIQNCSIPVSFTVASTKLSGTQLDEIYTALPSVTATITVTTNHGTPDDTPAIATGKGWTVTGS